MSEGFANDIVGGIGNLVRQWIQSPDYVAGVSGWQIARDGSAEFNNATFRGDVVIGPNAGPNIFIGSGIPAVLVTYYTTFYSIASLLTAIVKFQPDTSNYKYIVVGTVTTAGLDAPFLGTGWVLGGVTVKETDYNEMDITPSVVQIFNHLSDGGTIDNPTHDQNWFIGKSGSGGGGITINSKRVGLFTGGIPTSDWLINNVSQSRGLVLFERITSNHATTAATTEQTIFTTASAYDFLDSRAYLVEVVGQINCAAGAIRTRIRVRKGVGTGGTILVSPATSVIDTASTDCPVYIQSVFTNNSGGTVNTKLTITFQNTLAQIVNYDGQAAPTNTYIRVTDIGDTTTYSGVSL